MADVFVSYVSEDRGIAEKIARGLEGAGFSVWWDRHIHGGVGFRKEIDRQLGAAKVVVVLWSAASLESEWVCDEAQQALDEKKLIPLRLDGVQPPLGFRQAQSLDFSGWNGDPTVGAFADLVDSARQFVARPPTDAPPPMLPTASKRGRWRETRMIVGGVAVLSLAFAYFGVDNFWPSKRVSTERSVAEVAPMIAPAATVISEKSIAVLPFTDLSETKDQEYLADGMAEEVINLLARVPDLLVSARTSSFYFKGKPTQIPEIARELGVANVLEGSVRRAGDHLRVTVQLVRADNGYHVWSETYDRDLKGVFTVQDEIANAVVQALQIKLSGGELSRQQGGTQNLEAYLLYLRATDAVIQNSPSSLDAASEYLDQAIKLDPNYGKAWTRQSAIVMVKTISLSLAAAEGHERSQQLAQRALQVSPNNGDAHVRLAFAYLYVWDWTAAETEVRRALAIDSTNGEALFCAGNIAYALGRWDEAERQFRLARIRDPINSYFIFGLGGLYYKTGRFADAEAMFRRLLELAPGFVSARARFGHTLLADGKPEAALAMAEQSVSDGVGEGGEQLFLPIALQANGRRAEADALLKAEIPRWADKGAYFVAMNYAYRGDQDLALQWLERAYVQKELALTYIAGEPLFKNLVDDPRYKRFLRKMKLPE